MAEYIEKQAAMDKFAEVVAPSNHSDFQRAPTWNDAVDIIENFPPADVRPVVRGRWEMDSDNIPHCTECGCVAPQRLFLQLQSLACTTQFVVSNYCPDCGSYNGADMRGGDAE